MNKIGLSGVVVSVLIILLSLAAISIVWSYLNGTLQGAGNTLAQTSIDTGKTVVKITPGSEVYDILSGNLSFVVVAQDKVEGATQSGFKINVKDANGNTKGADYNVSLNQLESIKLFLDLNNSKLGKPKTIEVTPIYTLADGKRVYSINTQVYHVRVDFPSIDDNFPDNFVLNNSNLVAYYSFDENLTSVKDYSVNHNSGLLGGGILSSAPVWNKTGKKGGSFMYDGFDDYIEFQDSPDLNLQNTFTLSAWVYRTALKTDEKIIFKVPPSNDKGYGIGIYFHRLELNPAGFSCNIRPVPGGTNLGINQWYHLVATYNGTDCTTYVNGVIDRISPGGGTLIPTTATLRIGADQYVYPPAYDLNGHIDEVMIFNRSLTANEVANLCKYQNNFVSCS